MGDCVPYFIGTTQYNLIKISEPSAAHAVRELGQRSLSAYGYTKVNNVKSGDYTVSKAVSNELKCKIYFKIIYKRLSSTK